MTCDYCLLSLLLAFIAGLSTVLGGLIVFFLKRIKLGYLCVAFGFSAGVMIFISFTELLGQGIANTSFPIATLGFFGGMLLIYAIDVLIPHNFGEEVHDRKGGVKRAALLLIIGMVIHNFPEGMAVMFSSISSFELGLVMALAVALHNIPEGIIVSLPVYYATKDRKKALYYSFLSGIAEPIGALLSFVFLYQFLDKFVLGVVLSAVAGIMVFISFDELLPYVYKSRDGRNQHLSILGIFLGMFVIALTLMVM